VIGPDAAELRVLGCLIEKQRTTPDAYPLSLNALRLACNQSTGRDPVVDYDEQTIRDAIARLVRRGWARLASGPGSRATKYRHLLDDALSLSAPQLAVLAVLMLRGPQTPGELRLRSERMHDFGSVDELEALLEVLAGRHLALRFDRRPGQKEARWSLGEGFAGEDARPSAPAGPPAAEAPPAEDEPDIELRLASIERDLEELRSVVAQLRTLVD
jgi:uncharacterized protein YceH (UPF0502 family)